MFIDRAPRQIVALVAAGIVVLACQPSPSGTAQACRPPLAVQVESADGPVALARISDRLVLCVAGPDGDLKEVTAVERSDRRPTVHLVAYGGSTGRHDNSFVFGDAPVGAARVEIEPGAGRGVVAGGLYVVALPPRDLRPDQLVWRFLGAPGNVIASGTGIVE